MSVWPYSTKRWARLRLIKLAQSPCCEFCLKRGEVRAASAVDHKIPISAQGRKERRMAEGFPPLDWLMSLCDACHNRKSRGEQLGRELPIRGCHLDGSPIDPRHHWYK